VSVKTPSKKRRICMFSSRQFERNANWTWNISEYVHNRYDKVASHWLANFRLLPIVTFTGHWLWNTRYAISVLSNLRNTWQVDGSISCALHIVCPRSIYNTVYLHGLKNTKNYFFVFYVIPFNFKQPFNFTQLAFFILTYSGSTWPLMQSTIKSV